VNPSKVDKNEAPEGFYAVSGGVCAPCAFNGKPFCTYKEKYGKPPNCSSDRRLDDCHVHFIKKESEKTMEEYQYMTANILEAWHIIVDAIFSGDCEIKRNAGKYNKAGEFEISIVWDRATHIENGREYRWKKPAPPKVKKLVDRTAEDFWPLIGRYWSRDSSGRRHLILNDTWHATTQSAWQIAPLGTEEWTSMQVQKELEVEG
jgi:hypothetical protein